MKEHPYLAEDISEAKETQLCLDIIRLLEGAPIGQACGVLETTQALLLDFHTVDPSNPRYIKKFSEFACTIDPSWESRSDEAKAAIKQALVQGDNKKLEILLGSHAALNTDAHCIGEFSK